MYKLSDDEKRIGIFKIVILIVTIIVGVLGSFAVSYSDIVGFNGLMFAFAICLTFIAAFVLFFLFYALECIIYGLSVSKANSQNLPVKIKASKNSNTINKTISGIWKCPNCGTFNPSKNEKCYNCENDKK